MVMLLAVAALVAGITGGWSPCGFSMVETLAPHGYAGRRRVTVAACATFSVGALAGGVVTFGGLALLGQALGAGGATAAGVAAAVALVAAAGEVRGARIVPQVRRQVPEPWRRVLPVPLAAGLYGVLLGLGFTTFILTFAVWALAALSVALGDPSLGLAIGLGFGVGRALPVVGLAPIADTEAGSRAHAAMAERPAILRGLRALDAAALLACAVALAAGPASAATAQRIAAAATDPSAAGDVLVYHEPGGAGLLRRGEQVERLPGRFPAAGGGLVAWVDGDRIVVARADTLQPTAVYAAPRADAVAVSATRLAWRAADRLFALPLAGGVAAEVAAKGVGRPALDGDLLAYHQASRARSRLRTVDLATGARRTVARAKGALLLNPAPLGGELLYVRSTRTRQQLRLRARDGSERILLSRPPTARADLGREPGHGYHRHGKRVPERLERPKRGQTDTLWTTALTPAAAYVSRLRARGNGGATAVLLRVAR
ncbi:MAG TPA: hypothetical protein VF533_08325 [Solirubrobacteraceae bacterium]|jgi:hypothetical protein